MKPAGLYCHETDGGAKCLFDAFVKCPDGHKEGRITGKTKYAVRIDGDITKDAELTEAKNGTDPAVCLKERINTARYEVFTRNCKLSRKYEYQSV
jgi:hypothetical protein